MRFVINVAKQFEDIGGSCLVGVLSSTMFENAYDVNLFPLVFFLAKPGVIQVHLAPEYVRVSFSAFVHDQSMTSQHCDTRRRKKAKNHFLLVCMPIGTTVMDGLSLFLVIA